MEQGIVRRLPPDQQALERSVGERSAEERPPERSVEQQKANEKAFKAWRRSNHFCTFNKNTLFEHALKEANIPVLEHLLLKGCGKKSLSDAVWRGVCDEAICTLIAAGVDLNVGDRAGDTPLMNAALKSRLGIAKVLIAAGADKTLKHGGETALVMALSYKHYEIARLLGYKEEPEERPKKKKPASAWSVSEDEGRDLVIHTRYVAQDKTFVKDIFDFAAKRVLTELWHDDKPSSVLKESFADFNSEALKEAEARRTMDTPPKPARLKPKSI